MSGAKVNTQRLRPAGARSQEAHTELPLEPEREAWMQWRPRGVGALLDQAFSAYVAHFGFLVGVAVLCFVPIHLFFDSVVRPWSVQAGQEVWFGVLRDVLPAMLTSGLVTLHLGGLLLGRPGSPGKSFWGSVRALPGLLGLYVLRSVTLIVLCCLLIIPGLLSVWFLAASSAIYLLEKSERGAFGPPWTRLTRSISRSVRLSFRWDSLARFLGFCCVATVLVYFPMLGIAALQDSPDLRASLLSSGYFDPRFAQLSMVLVGAVGMAAGAVFFDIFYTLFYFDLCVRREALDLKLELEALKKRRQAR